MVTRGRRLYRTEGDDGCWGWNGEVVVAACREEEGDSGCCGGEAASGDCGEGEDVRQRGGS